LLFIKTTKKKNSPRSAPVHDSMMIGWISKQLCTSGIPSGGLNES